MVIEAKVTDFEISLKLPQRHSHVNGKFWHSGAHIIAWRRQFISIITQRFLGE